MKQKEKWADEYVEQGRDGDDCIDAASYVGWLAGFEFAKQEILKLGGITYNPMIIGEDEI